MNATPSSAPVSPATTDFSVTDAAARRISQIMKKEAEGSFLRLSVEGGGCSGFSYKYDVTTQQNDDDLIIEKNGAKVVVDAISLELVRGSELDYVSSLMGSAFQVRNPQATASCGCGTSFSV
ncbi:iron-sulfur cluster insertion protein ErpA [Xanthobacter sp. TB0139]|uniref:iron-sulfur cluster insertion protein ErpA n=1 Tax=Xanthobacter sp. TB0139 TaxID=3459178 RepID=UPI00403A7A8A